MSDPMLPSHNGDLSANSSGHINEKNRETGQPKTNAPGDLVVKNHAIACLGEFVGTTLFIFFSLGGTSVALQAQNSVTGDVKDGASTFNTSNLFFIAVMFGASLGTNVWCFFRISGGLFNPAVTTAFVIVGAITPIRGVLLFITQLIGGLAGAALADVLTPGPLLAETTLGGGASVSRGFFIEFFMTFMLVTSILLLAGFKNRATFIAPLGIGLSFFICEMFSVNYTGGALNPARALGPAATNHHFPNYHWIYWIAPLCGAALAAAFFLILKHLKYETNLGPDCDDDGFTYGYQLDMRDRLERVENHLANLSTHYVPGRQVDQNKAVV